MGVNHFADYIALYTCGDCGFLYLLSNEDIWPFQVSSSL